MKSWIVYALGCGCISGGAYLYTSHVPWEVAIGICVIVTGIQFVRESGAMHQRLTLSSQKDEKDEEDEKYKVYREI